MKKTKGKTSEGKDIAEKHKREREQKKTALATIKGKVVDNKLSNKDVSTLLQVICLELSITDENNAIQ